MTEARITRGARHTPAPVSTVETCLLCARSWAGGGVCLRCGQHLSLETVRVLVDLVTCERRAWDATCRAEALFGTSPASLCALDARAGLAEIEYYDARSMLHRGIALARNEMDRAQTRLARQLKLPFEVER